MAKRFEDNYGVLETRIKQIDKTMAIVVIVLLIGFASMFVAVLSLVINADGEKHASYQQLEEQVQVQNYKIDALTKALEKQ
jgi:hypothetical protein